MNILFLYGGVIDPQKGGVQRVTSVLADYFEGKGNNVYYLSANQAEGHLAHHSRQYYLPEKSILNCSINRTFLNKFVEDKEIEFLINQGGLGIDISQLSFSLKDTNVKIVQVLHSSILSKIYHFDSAFKKRFKAKGMSWLLPLTKNKLVKNILLQIYKQRYASHFKELCKKSDKVVLLSSSYFAELEFFIGSLNFDKVSVIANPCSFSTNNGIFNKKKEILYVGKVNTAEKRIDLLLYIWAKIYKYYPDWKLTIVGGGDELPQMKKLANKLNLQNFSFEGFQDPKPYYERASIFAMTSSYEGFPMVLPEAMQYSLVPFAFNSFTSVNDIIDDDVNGCLVEPFDLDIYTSKLSGLIDDSDKLDQMSACAFDKSKLFSICNIGDLWLQLLNNLTSNDDR